MRREPVKINMDKRVIETCFSPALYEAERHKESVVVVIDILRASSAICTAFANGAKTIIPVATVEEARDYKNRGYLVAAERDGYILDFADFGNSPFNFTSERVGGKTIVYSTTNGTGIINQAKDSAAIVVGSFLNISSLVKWIVEQDRDVLLFCAGWKKRFSLEDALGAGAMAKRLFQGGRFSTICDSTFAAIDLWEAAEKDPWAYIQKAAQRSRLRDKGLDDCIEFCLTADLTSKIPIVKDGVLVD